MIYEYQTGVTKEDFKKALREKNLLNDKQLELLSIIYQLERHEATASQLALLTNQSHHGTINLQFAQIAKKISKYIEKPPPIRSNGTNRWWAFLANTKAHEQYWFWILKPELVAAIEELRLFDYEDIHFPEEIRTEKVYHEGLLKRITVNAYERNPQARKLCIEYYGLNCAVCAFNFKKSYGDIGIGYIHVHHLKPIAEIGGNYEIDPIKDLRPICPNCHAMIHRLSETISIEELKETIKNNKLFA